MNHAASITTAYSDETRAPRAPWWDRSVAAGLGLLLLWAPLPLGSNRPWAAALLLIVTWGLVASHLAFRARDAAPTQAGHWRRSLWLLAPLAAYALLICGQWLGLGFGPWHMRTLETSATRFYALIAIAHVGMACLILLCAHNNNRIRQILAVLVAAGVLQAVLAVLLLSQRKSFWFLFTEFPFNGRASGTFPNPDHLAGYMELCLTAGFGLLVAQFGGASAKASARSNDWQLKLRSTMQFLLSAKMLLRMTLVVLVIALVMTHSRMGNGAFFLALLAVGGLLAAVSRKLRKPALWLVASMLLLDVLIIGQWVGLDRVVERLQYTARATALDESAMALPELAKGQDRKEESLQERMLIPKLSLQLLEASPWVGTGAGTYYLRLAPIKPAGFPHLWDHAHNDYVEVAIDTGLVGLALLLLPAAATLVRAVRLLRDSEPRLHRGVGVAALMALLCLGLHSLVDFNLQIPANAMTLVVLMALPWAVPATDPLVPKPRRRSAMASRTRLLRRATAGEEAAAQHKLQQQAAHRKAWALLALPSAVLCIAFALGPAGRTLVVDFGTQQARNAALRCGQDLARWSEQDWAPVQQTLQWGLQAQTDNAVLHVLLAQLHACRGAAMWDDENRSIAEYQQAVNLLQAALLLRPGHGATWAAMTMALYGANAEYPEFNHAWKQALRFGPHEAPVQVALFEAALRGWAHADADAKSWVSAQYLAATPKGQKRLYALARQLQAEPSLPPPAPEISASAPQ